MSKITKMNDFRKLNLSSETTPAKKNVGAVSVKNKQNNNLKNKKDDNVKKNEGKNYIGFAVFILVLVVSGALVGCLFTPVFNVINVEIQTGNYVEEDEIRSRTNDVIGENIFRININSLKKAIKDIPYVKGVDISRSFPDTINVVIDERVPYAIIKYLESYVVVDKYGYVLEIMKENLFPDLAIIYGINADEYIVGKRIDDIAGLKYENITYLLETTYKNDFDYTIYEINYTDTEKLVIAVKELDVDIIFGEVERNILTEKVTYLNGILNKLKNKKGSLDISSNNYLEKTIFTERY